jgi:hypothetical protein
MTAFSFDPWHDWFDSVYEDFCQIAEILGFDVSAKNIQFSGFWSQGDGASFTGSYAYAKQSAKRIRECAPKDTELHAIADMLAELQRRNFYQLTGRVYRVSHQYSHSNTIRAECQRDSAQDATSDSDDILTDAARRLSDWLYSALESEYEYQQADAAGRYCGEKAQEVLTAGRAYIAALRDVRDGFKARRAPLPHGQIVAFVRRRAQDARELRDEYHELRDVARKEIDELKPGRRGWNAKYREAWLDGYASV